MSTVLISIASLGGAFALVYMFVRGKEEEKETGDKSTKIIAGVAIVAIVTALFILSALSDSD